MFGSGVVVFFFGVVNYFLVKLYLFYYINVVNMVFISFVILFVFILLICLVFIWRI